MDRDEWTRLKDAGFPEYVVNALRDNPRDWPPVMEEKLKKALELHPKPLVGQGCPQIELGRVMLVLGKDSPEKDAFLVRIAQHFVQNGLKPMLLDTTAIKNLDGPLPAYAVFVSGISYLSTKDWTVKKMGELLRQHVAMGRVLVLEAEIMGEIELAFGSPFMHYISSFGVEIQLASNKPKMPKL